MALREWKKVSSSTIYEDKFMRVRKDEVINPGGKKQSYAYIENSDAVAVIAQDDDGGIYLLQEYRYPVKKVLWQTPAGHLEKELNLLENAKKELKEETGISAHEWKHLGCFHMHASMETMQGNVFLAKNLDKTRMGTRDKTTMK